MRKPVLLRLQHEDGETLHWRMLKIGKFWSLFDHNNYERTLEETWNMSVPRVRIIAENHGCRFLHDFS